MARKPKLIFLMGFKNTGKDTFADLLKKEYEKDGQFQLVTVALADAIKRDVYPKYGVEFTNSLVEDREFKEKVRDELISYGESQKREHGMYHWITTAIEPIVKGKLVGEFPDIIVTDCRRTEEVMWYKFTKMKKYPSVFSEFYDMSFFVVHKEDAEAQDNDYLTKVASFYAAESHAMDKLIRNYGTIEALEAIAKEVYAVKLR